MSTHRVLVTGASGFIGRHVVRALAMRGHEVIANGRDVARLAANRGTARRMLALDLAADPLEPLLAGCDTVVHCAALSAPWGPDAAFQRANVLATRRLLDAARRAGARRFLHLGSPSIYFRFRDQYDIGEAFTPPRRWITGYARSKWESEDCVRGAGDDLQTLILRPRAVFGDGDRAILPRLLAVAERGWFPLIAGGDALIDVTDVDNLSRLIADCVDHGWPGSGQAYNVTNGEPLRVKDLLSALFARMRRRVRWIPVPRGPALAAAWLAEQAALRRAGQPEPKLTRYGLGVIGYAQTLDITRARRELGYRPIPGVAAGLEGFASTWSGHDHA